MRNLIFAAGLVLSAQAVKMSKLRPQAGEPQPQEAAEVGPGKRMGPPPADDSDAAQQMSMTNMCYQYTETEPMDLTNSKWADNFDTDIFWYDGMKDFWQIFDESSSFCYFDCYHGNCDGMLTFDEYQAGLYVGGFTENSNCTADYTHSWEEFYNTTDSVVNKTQFMVSWKDQMNMGWKQFQGNNWNETSFPKFMNTAEFEFGMDEFTAATWWFAASMENMPNENGDDENGALYKQTYRKNTKTNAISPLWQYYNTQYYNRNEGGLLGQALWYFSQGCFSADSYWTALSGEPSVMAWQDDIAYTADQYAENLCKVWQLC